MDNVYVHFRLTSPHRLPFVSSHIPPDGTGCVESGLQVLVQLEHITWHIKSQDLFFHVIVNLSQTAYLAKL